LALTRLLVQYDLGLVPPVGSDGIVPTPYPAESRHRAVRVLLESWENDATWSQQSSPLLSISAVARRRFVTGWKKKVGEWRRTS